MNMKKKSRIFTISNMMSLARVFLMLPILYLFPQNTTESQIYLFALLALAILTDYLDGVLARKLNQVTELGKILDPVADKICIGLIVILLVIYRDLPLWFVIVVLSRDLVIMLGSLLIMYKRHQVLKSNKSGKWTVFFLSLTCLIFIFAINLNLDIDIDFVKLCSITISVLMIAWSLISYGIRFVKVMREPGRDEAVPELKKATDDALKDSGISASDRVVFGEKKNKLSEFKKLKKGLSKTREGLVGKIARIIKTRKKINDDLLDEIEEILIAGDVGVAATSEVIDELKAEIKKQGYQNSEDVLDVLKKSMANLMHTDTEQENGRDFFESDEKPYVIMVVGVNGTGKTTTIGKLANHFKARGKRVLLSAADTFRAAAAEQLDIWADRADVEIVRNQPGSDPAAVAFDSLNAAIARDLDVLIVDTAGRLHTKVNLMEEVKKIRRVLTKRKQTAPHEVLLVLDATTGQNGLSQARQFLDTVGVTGLVLTKLDGTAKGGIVLSIRRQLNLPVRFIGIGEAIDDLEEFDAEQYVEALFQ